MSLDRTARDATEQALGRLRLELSPSSADKERLRQALGLGTSAPAPVNRAPAPETVAAPAPLLPAVPLTERAALLASGKLGAALGALLFAAGIAVGWSLQQAIFARQVSPASALPASTLPASTLPASALPEGPTPAVTDSQAASVTDPASQRVAPVLSVQPEVTRSKRSTSQPRPPVPPAAVPQSKSPLDAELALLRRVERALRANDPALAVALLAELDGQFPQTRLVEERLAARSMADCRLGTPDAVARARRFLSERPASVYSERVQLACALETSTPSTAH